MDRPVLFIQVRTVTRSQSIGWVERIAAMPLYPVQLWTRWHITVHYSGVLRVPATVNSDSHCNVMHHLVPFQNSAVQPRVIGNWTTRRQTNSPALQLVARVEIRGPRSLFTIKRRNNTYDVTHFSYFDSTWNLCAFKLGKIDTVSGLFYY